MTITLFVQILNSQTSCIKTSIIFNYDTDFYKQNPVRPEVIELRNMAIASRLLIRCATLRKESRGLHYNIDYPEKNDNEFKNDTIIKRGEN